MIYEIIGKNCENYFFYMLISVSNYKNFFRIAFEGILKLFELKFRILSCRQIYGEMGALEMNFVIWEGGNKFLKKFK